MKFKKFAILLLAISSHCFSQTIDDLHYFPKTKEEINSLGEKIKYLKDNDILPKGLKFDLIFNNQKSTANVFYNIISENCSIFLNPNIEGKYQYLGNQNNYYYFKDLIKFNSYEDKLYFQYVALHEASHCKLLEINNPFNLENKKLTQIFNDYYLYSLSSNDTFYSQASIYQIFHETFADVYSLVQLLKTEDLENTLFLISKIKAARKDFENIGNNDNYIIPHNTSYALSLLLKKDNIELLKNMKNKDDLINFSLKITNENIDFLLKQQFFEPIYYEQNIVYGIYQNIKNILINNIEKQHTNIVVENKENKIFVLTKEIYNKINKDFLNLPPNLAKNKFENNKVFYFLFIEEELNNFFLKENITDIEKLIQSNITFSNEKTKNDKNSILQELINEKNAIPSIKKIY